MLYHISNYISIQSVSFPFNGDFMMVYIVGIEKREFHRI